MKKNVIEKTGIVGIAIEFSTEEIKCIKELQDKFLKKIWDSTDLEILSLLAKITEGFKTPENVQESLFGVVSIFTPKEQTLCRANIIAQTSLEKELENADKKLIKLEENSGVKFIHLSVKGEDVYKTVVPSRFK